MMSYYRYFPYELSLIAIVSDHGCEVFFIINFTDKVYLQCLLRKFVCWSCL